MMWMSLKRLLLMVVPVARILKSQLMLTMGRELQRCHVRRCEPQCHLWEVPVLFLVPPHLQGVYFRSGGSPEVRSHRGYLLSSLLFGSVWLLIVLAPVFAFPLALVSFSVLASAPVLALLVAPAIDI